MGQIMSPIFRPEVVGFQDTDTRVLFCKSSVNVTSDDDDEYQRGVKRPYYDDTGDFYESMAINKKHRGLQAENNFEILQDGKECIEKRVPSEDSYLSKCSTRLLRARKCKKAIPTRMPRVPSNRSSPARTLPPTSLMDVLNSNKLKMPSSLVGSKAFGSKESSELTIYKRTIITVTSSEYLDSDPGFGANWKNQKIASRNRKPPATIDFTTPTNQKGIQVLPAVQHRKMNVPVERNAAKCMTPQGDATSGNFEASKAGGKFSQKNSKIGLLATKHQTPMAKALSRPQYCYPVPCLKKSSKSNVKKKSVSFSTEALAQKDAIRVPNSPTSLETYPLPVQKGRQMFMSQHFNLSFTPPSIRVATCREKAEVESQSVVQMKKQVVQISTTQSVECSVQQTEEKEKETQPSSASTTKHIIGDLFPQANLLKVRRRRVPEPAENKAKKCQNKVPDPKIKVPKDPGKTSKSPEPSESRKPNQVTEKDKIFLHLGHVQNSHHPLKGKTLAAFVKERSKKVDRLVKRERTTNDAKLKTSTASSRAGK